MLGGGTFVKQNKILPGSYINFVSARNIGTNISERGVVALGLELDWGKDNEIIEVTSEQFNKQANILFGYDYGNEKLKGLRDLFKNAAKGYFYKLNSDGQKASNNYATARYAGKRGNDLKIVIEKNVDDENKFDVITLLENSQIDKQTVSKTSELLDNEYVIFKKEATLDITASTPLEGGTNGSVTGKSHQDFLNKVESYNFNALGCLSKETEITTLYIAFTKRLREEQGVKFQTVVYNNQANYEGVVNLKNSAVEEETGLIYWVVGTIAGCNINTSNTNKTYDGEYTVNSDYTQIELEECIQKGEFVLHKVGSEIKVLVDINSLTTESIEKGEAFKSNQTIRVLDQIATDIANIFNKRYLGKIQNNDSGRVSLWNDVVSLFKEYATLQAIENFDSKEITVEQGNDKKTVVVNSSVQIINAMEKLYMSVVVS